MPAPLLVRQNISFSPKLHQEINLPYLRKAGLSPQKRNDSAVSDGKPECSPENSDIMTPTAAASLVSFINHTSIRFTARSQNYEGKSWVIVRDDKTHQRKPYIEPVLNLIDYLARDDRFVPLDAEYRELLEACPVLPL